jgi:monoamine oxidase
LSDGRVRVTVARDEATRDEIADRVILALPFSLLKEVDLDHAGFRARKLAAIRDLGMGRNTKLQLQFRERAWRASNGNGETRVTGSYLTSWEVTRAQSGAPGILNFFSGGALAVRAGDGAPEQSARIALADLERCYPGLGALWNGKVIRNAWDRHPWSRGSYSLLKPGQYTAFHGAEWESEGAVHFAGEHTSDASSGYLNGAVESGQRAAREVLASLRVRHARRAA